MTLKNVIKQIIYAIIIIVIINIINIFLTHKKIKSPVKSVSTEETIPPGMVFIPGGMAIIGTDPEQEKKIPPSFGISYEPYRDEQPRRTVYVKSFVIDRYEVTIGQYRQFCQDTGREEPESWKNSLPENPDQYPAYGITWTEANAYAKWIGKRLPSEAEWEKAARGTQGQRFVWGDTFDPKINQYLKGFYPVGTNPIDVSFYKVHDMTANVSEWTAEYYAPYPGNDYSRIETKDGENKLYVWRGYHFKNKNQEHHYDIPYFYRAAYRGVGDPETRYATAGFRCAWSLP